MGCVLSYRFSHSLQTSYETTLDKTPNFISFFVLPLLAISTIQTNRLHHLHLILSTDEELTLTSYKVKTWSRLSSCQTCNGCDQSHRVFIRISPVKSTMRLTSQQQSRIKLQLHISMSLYVSNFTNATEPS